MTNIQKIADEIFQAPTKEELLRRATEDFIKNPDGTYNANGDVRIEKGLISPNGKLLIRFKKVNGSFDISNHSAFGDPYMTSLEGCPQFVNGDFNCAHNGLSTLRGSPISVGRDFYCYSNNLKNLKGVPGAVGGDFNCSKNLLDSLVGCPREVEDFFCYENHLKSLKGCPTKVNGTFDCDSNSLTTLNGCPEVVRGDFLCRDNHRLFTEEEVKAVCKVKGKIYV